jgi:hypothetical protein
MGKRAKVIKRLKERARKHFFAAQVPDYMDCGLHLAGVIFGKDYESERDAYMNCVARLRRIDKTFPQKGA